VLQCAGRPQRPEWTAGLVEAMGTPPIGRESLGPRRAFWNEVYKQAIQRFVIDAPPGALEARFEGVRIEKNWSTAYYTEFLSSSASQLDMLSGFHGAVRYLYGEYDQQMEIPSAAEFSAEARKRGLLASMKIVPHVGHGLEDERGLPTIESMEAIVSSLRSVTPPPST